MWAVRASVVAFFEVFFFSGEFFEFEVDEAVGLFDFIDYDVGGVVAEFSSSDLTLLYPTLGQSAHFQAYNKNGVHF